MTGESVLVSVADGIGRIEVSRAVRRNAIDNASAQRITQALAAFADDPGCRGAVLLGTGGDLSSGADLKDPSGAAPGAPSPRTAMLAAIADCPVPVVSVVDGWAIGLGVAMAAASYATVVTDRAKFRLPEAAMGMFPFAVVPYLTGRMRPHEIADLVLTGRTVTAPEALRLGLASAHAVPGEGETMAAAIIAAATRPPRAVVTETLAWLRREMGAL